jgi:transketolase
MLSEIQSTGTKDTRSGFGDGILEAARENPNIIALTADLAGSLKLNGFIK